MEKIYNNILSPEDIDYLTQHEETITAKDRLDSLRVDSLRVDSLRVDSLDVVNFSIDLTASIQKVIQKQFGLTLSSVPMRWIKGDTPEHTDHSSVDFQHTYLIYLTDSIGEFVLDTTSYEIVKNTAFKFNEGVSHKTINTGTIPRLLLGPMNEFGVTVGASYSVNYYDTDKTAYLGGGGYTIGTIISGNLMGYTQWKIFNTNNTNITDFNIVYSNGTSLPPDFGFSYDLYAYVPPPVMSFNMRSLFTNNAQVYYKPHSLAPGGVGGVKNCRIKSKKT